MNTDLKQVVINAPPPYLNSSLHIGHLYAFSTLTPFYNLVDLKSRESKFKSFKQYFEMISFPKINLRLSLGVDINGLPLTRAAKEKSIKENLSYSQACLELISTNTKNIQKIYQDLGLYNLREVTEYSTEDDKFIPFYNKFLEVLTKKGLLQEKKLPLRYCKNCGTFVSNSETELVPTTGKRYVLKVHEKSNPNLLLDVMTTRPDLLMGVCGFIAHPQDTRYTHLKGKDIGFQFEGVNYYFPMLYSKLVHPKVGTGLVYLTRWGSLLDLELCRDLKIQGGSTIYDQNGEIIDKIKTTHNIKTLDELIPRLIRSSILSVIEEEISINCLKHTERGDCKSEILFLESSEVVISLDEKTLVEFIQYINKLNIPVLSFKHQLIENVKSLKEWCISRSPDYYSFEYEFEGRTLKLDTWVISSLTHFINSTPGSEIWRIQGNDIIRTWLVYSLFANFILASEDRVISKCFVHKMVVDENYQKISKSKNNGPNARLLLDTVDTSSLRYYFCQKPFNNDFSFNMKELNDNIKFFNKVKNLDVKITQILEYSPLDLSLIKCTWNKMIENSIEGVLGDTPLERIITEFTVFFQKDLLSYNFTRILNKLKTFVYSLSSNICQLEVIMGASLTKEERNGLLYVIWTFIMEFLSCFKS